MTVSDLEGIANVQFQSIAEITWETETDWDSSVDRERVITRDIGDRNPQEIWLGYDPDLLSNLHAYWTLDDDSGNIIDVTGNGHDATEISGSHSYNQDGLLSSTSVHFPDSNRRMQIPNSSTTNTGDNGAITAWVYISSYDSEDNEYIFTNPNFDDDERLYFGTRADNEFQLAFAGTNQISTNFYPNSNQWYLFGATWDNGDWDFYVDGQHESSGTYSNSVDMGNSHWNIGGYCGNTFGEDFSSGNRFIGRIDELMLWNDSLSSSDHQSLYQTSQDGYLTTTTKSFAIEREPNLFDLDYELNSEDITIDVIGSPGTSEEETVSQTLDGATGYSLSWTNPHTDFQVTITPATSDVNTTPQLNRVTLRG